MEAKRYRRQSYPVRYSAGNVKLLAEVDNPHEGLSGPATRKLLEGAWQEFGNARFQRLVQISVDQIYRQRQRPAYRRQRLASTLSLSCRTILPCGHLGKRKQC